MDAQHEVSTKVKFVHTRIMIVFSTSAVLHDVESEKRFCSAGRNSSSRWGVLMGDKWPDVQAGQAVVVASGGGPSMGALLQGLGRRLAGKKVMRHWPDNGGWWEADVDTYNASSGQHRCPTLIFTSPNPVGRLAALASSTYTNIPLRCEMHPGHCSPSKVVIIL